MTEPKKALGRWHGPSGKQGDQFRKTLDFAALNNTRLVPLEEGKGTRQSNWWENAFQPKEVSRAAFRGVNIGHANGYGNVIDVDFDDSYPASRRLAYKLFREPTASFGRGGVITHRMYSVDGIVSSRRLTSKNYETIIELRGNRTQTMAPGSKHPDSGELIEWYDESLPLQIDARALGRRIEEYAAGCVLLRHWKEGIRHDLAAALTGYLIRYCKWSDKKIDSYIRALRHAAGDKQKHEKAAYERERIAADQAAYGKSNLKAILGPDYPDVEKWLGITVEEHPLVEADITGLAILAADYVKREIPEEIVAIDGFFSRRKLMLFYGRSGAGKSFILTFIADALGRGSTIAEWKVVRPLRVLYVEAEMDETEFHGRAKSILADNKNVIILRPEAWESLFGRPGPYIDGKEDQQILERLIELQHIDVLIIEPLSWVLRDADENSNEDTKLYMPWFRKLKNSGKTVLTAHNQGWTKDDRRIRGASRIVDSMDLTFSVSASKGTRGKFMIEQEKARTKYPMTPKIVTVAVEPGGEDRQVLVRRYDNKNRRIQLLETWAADPTVSYRGLAERFGVDEKTISRDVAHLESDGYVRKAGRDRIVTDLGRQSIEYGSLVKPAKPGG